MPTKVPATQSVHAVAAVATMNLPVGHDVHAATPTVAVLLYFPAAQSVQVRAPSREVFPDTQDVQEVAPAAAL